MADIRAELALVNFFALNIIEVGHLSEYSGQFRVTSAPLCNLTKNAFVQA